MIFNSNQRFYDHFRLISIQGKTNEQGILRGPAIIKGIIFVNDGAQEIIFVAKFKG